MTQHNDYWVHGLEGLFAKENGDDNKQVATDIPPPAALPNADALIAECKATLLREFEELSRHATTYFHQRVINDIDGEIKVAVRQFETDLSAKLTRTMLSVQTAPMPPGTRFALPFGNSTVYIIEQEPTVRSIYHTGGVRTLAFPYMVFGLNVDKNGIPGHLHVGCSNKPLNSLEDPLYRIHLSNIYQNINKMGVCDSMLSNGGAARKGSTIAQKVAAILTQFWSSQWNDGGMTSQCKDPQVGSLSKWAENSKKDPMFILTVKWEDAKITVRKFAEGLAGSNLDNLEQTARLSEDYRELSKQLSETVKQVLQNRLNLEKL